MDLIKKSSLKTLLGRSNHSVLIVLAVAFFYFPLLTLQKHLTWDSLDYSFPLAVYLRDSLRAGVWPLWNPFILSGDAVFAHPAVSAYHPLYFLIAALPEGVDLLLVFQLLLGTLPFIGAFGFRRLLSVLNLSEVSKTVGASIYGITIFGPLLGQLQIAFGLAVFPWFLSSATRMLLSQEFSARPVLRLSVLGAIYFYGTYFGTILYSVCFSIPFLITLALRSKLRARQLLPGLAGLLASGVVVVGLAMPHLIPAFENRDFFYSAIDPDFVSPDPRVRGIRLPLDHVVEIIPNERTLLGVLLNSQKLASDGAFWVIAPGYLVLIFAFFVSWFYLSKAVNLAFLAAFLIGTSYLFGPKSLVFDLVYQFVPLINNIRYPVFSFSFVAIALIIWSSLSLDKFLSNRSSRIQRFFLFAGIIEVILFSWMTGMWGGRIPNIVAPSSVLERERAQIQEREQTPVSESQGRELQGTEASHLSFDDRRWLLRKTHYSHGYSTADTPVYWYLKEAGFVEKLAYCPHSILVAIEPPWTQAKLESIRDSVSRVGIDSVYADAGVISALSQPLGECQISSIKVSPNRAELEVLAMGDTILVFTDKMYPGWRATLNGVSTQILTVNYLFKGVVLPKGAHRISFQFSPSSVWIGVQIAVTSIFLLIIWVSADCIFRLRQKKPSKN